MGATYRRVRGTQCVAVEPADAASELARDFGVEVEEAVLLQDTNNMVFW